MVTRGIMAALALGLGFAAPAAACGPTSDCPVGERAYRIRMPEGHDGAALVGAILFAHGYQGSAAGTMASKGLARVTEALGLALIAADADGEDWAIPGAPQNIDATGADELAYFDALMADATTRFAIDPDRIMVTGFSAGGMMVWTLICHRPDRFAAFAPMAGVFWRPIPESCATPAASVLHIHGARDRTVPLEGRAIGAARQGDVRDTIAMYARVGGFGAAASVEDGALRCKRRRNPDGAALEFCLDDGDHRFDADYVRYAWARFVALGKL